MRIDRTHRSWFIASLVILGASLALFAVYRVPAGNGSMGGTAAGLAFGSAGFAFMIFAALLGARKRVPVYRFGRAQTWMRGHLWLGLLSLPLILLTMGLFILVVNALMLELVAFLVKGFHVESFWTAFFGSILIGFVSWVLSAFFRDKDGKAQIMTNSSQMKQASGRVIDI